eukprot:330556-Rhodomonas_salina.1
MEPRWKNEVRHPRVALPLLLDASAMVQSVELTRALMMVSGSKSAQTLLLLTSRATAAGSPRSPAHVDRFAMSVAVRFKFTEHGSVTLRARKLNSEEVLVEVVDAPEPPTSQPAGDPVGVRASP